MASQCSRDGGWEKGKNTHVLSLYNWVICVGKEDTLRIKSWKITDKIKLWPLRYLLAPKCVFLNIILRQ